MRKQKKEKQSISDTVIEQKNYQESNLVNLSSLSSETPYSAEYLSLLCRKGKLKAVKKGKTWYSTVEWMGEYMGSVKDVSKKIVKKTQISDKQIQSSLRHDLMSLTAMEKEVPYSAAYLALRIRQGKLKGEKVGRNWHTKKEWIDEYVDEHGDQAVVSEYVSKQQAVKEGINKYIYSISDYIKTDISGITKGFGNFFVSKNFQRALASLLVATTVWSFSAVPQVWAHWGEQVADKYVSAVNMISKKVSVPIKGWSMATDKFAAQVIDPVPVIIGGSLEKTVAVAINTKNIISNIGSSTNGIAKESSFEIKTIKDSLIEKILLTSTKAASLPSSFYRKSKNNLKDGLAKANSVVSNSTNSVSKFGKRATDDIVDDINEKLALGKTNIISFKNNIIALAQKGYQIPGAAFANIESTQKKSLLTSLSSSGKRIANSLFDNTMGVTKRSVIDPAFNYIKGAGVKVAHSYKNFPGNINLNIFDNPGGEVAGESIVRGEEDNSTEKEKFGTQGSKTLAYAYDTVKDFKDTSKVLFTESGYVLGESVEQIGSVAKDSLITGNQLGNSLANKIGSTVDWLFGIPNKALSGLAKLGNLLRNNNQNVTTLVDLRDNKESSESKEDNIDEIGSAAQQTEDGIVREIIRVVESPSGSQNQINESNPQSLSSNLTLGNSVQGGLTVSGRVRALGGIEAPELQIGSNDSSYLVADVEDVEIYVPLRVANDVFVSNGNNLRVSGILTVDGDTILGSDLSVAGNFTVAGSFNPRSISSSGSISGQSISASGPIHGDSVNAQFGSFEQLGSRNAIFGNDSSDTFTVQGTATFKQSLSVSSDLSAGGLLSVNGAGTSTFAGGISISDGCYRLPNGDCAGSIEISGGANSGTAGQIAYYADTTNVVSATSSIFLSTQGFFGIGATTSPWGTLSVEQLSGTNPVFVVADQGTSTAHLIVDASGNVGINVATTSVALAVGGTSAIRIPVGTTLQRPVNPNAGLLRYNITQSSFEGYDGANWSGLGGVIDVDQDTKILAEESSDEDFLRFYTAGTQAAFINSQGQFSIGSSTPSAVFTVSTSTDDTLLTVYSSNPSNATTTLAVYQFGTGDILNLYDGSTSVLSVIDGGNVGIGSSTPYAKLSVVTTQGSTDDVFTVASSTQSYFNISSTGTTTISNLVTGALSFDTNAGVVSWADLPVTSAAVSGSVQSYSAQIDGNVLITVYAESNGGGSINNPSVGIGSSTPWARFSIEQSTSTRPVFVVADQGTSTPSFIVNGAGQIGIGTTTPGARFAVRGSGTSTGRLFVLSDSANVERLTVLDNGNIGLGTTSPSSVLTINATQGSTADLLTVSSSTDEYLSVSSTGTTTISNLVTGALSFDTNAGAVTWTDLPVTSAAAAGTIERYTAKIDNQSILTVYAESDGSGGIQNQRIGISTSTPSAALSVVGNTYLDSNVITLATSSASSLTVAYAASATSTIVDSQRYAFTIATSTTANPIFRIDTSGSGASGKATTTITGGFVVDGGGISYDFSSGVTSIDNLELGALNFDTNAGIVSWTDLPVTSAASAGTVQSYSAQIDGNALITVYAESNGGGSINNPSVGIGSSTPWARFSIEQSTSTSPVFVVADQGTSTPSFIITGQGNVGLGTALPTAMLTVNAVQGDTRDLFTVSSSTDEYLSISSTGTTTISNLVTGATGFDTNAGFVSWIDLPVTAAASVGTVEAYSAQIDGNDIFVVYAESNGGGGIQNASIGIGTTSPWAQFAIEQSTSTKPIFVISDQGTSSPLFLVNGRGSIGIGATTTDVGSSNIPDGSVIVDGGALCVDNGSGNCAGTARSGGVIYAVANSVTAIDLAETYPTKDDTLSSGEIASLDDENPVFIARANSGDKIVGVISTEPGVLLGGFGNGLYADETKVNLALSGRVPVKVNLDGGDIEIGDRITLSDVSGVGKKAIASGQTIGIALEPFNSESEGDSIIVFVDLVDTISANELAVAENGNIGIGTQDASEKLTVAGNIYVSGEGESKFDGQLRVIGDLMAANLNGSGSGLTDLSASNLQGILSAVDGYNLTRLNSSVLDGDLPVIGGINLTSLSSAALQGALPALDGFSLTRLNAQSLEGDLPAISGANLTSLNSDVLFGTVTVLENRVGVGSSPDNSKFSILQSAIGESAIIARSSDPNNASSTLAVYQEGVGRGLYVYRTNPNAFTAAAEIRTATSTALTLISESGSASSTLSVYQLGSGPIVTFTDANNATPVFRIAANTRDVQIREDLVQFERSDYTEMENLVDIFTYDTTRDSDAGRWVDSASFPQKAVLALTSDSLYIYDAKDNSLWMRFDEGGNDLTDMNLLGSANTDHNAIWAKNGIIYVANSSDSQGDGEGLLAINLKSDNTTIYTDSNNGVLTFNGVISQRNTESLGYDTQDSNLSFANANINDISVSNINGIDYIAVATQEGVSVINTQNNNIIDYDVNAQDSATNVYLTDAGTLYYTTETGQNLNVFFNIHTQTNDNTTDNGYSADIIYNQSSQPAIFTTAQDINDIEVVDNQVFIAHNAGLTVLNENQDNPSLSSVKYYGKDYITEEQIGDIRALYTFEDLEDKSVKGNNLTDSGASQTASGVRGLARTTAGSLTQTDSSVQFDPSSDSYSYGFWVKEGSIFHHYARIVRDGNATDYKDGQITTSNFDSSTVAISTSGITIASGKTIDDFFLTATPLTTQNIQSMYEIGRRAVSNHLVNNVSGILNPDSYQQLYGDAENTTSLAFDKLNKNIYLGTNNNIDGGAVSSISLESDTLVDVWSQDLSRKDDDNTAWDSDDIVSIAVTSRYPATLAIATQGGHWIQTERFSLDRFRSIAQDPHGEHLIQTKLTVQHNLTVGDSFTVYGSKVLGEQTRKPAFKVASDGTITAREDIILAGKTSLQQLSGIKDVFVYDTTIDTDLGQWIGSASAKNTSWYNETIDARPSNCDIETDNRCGSKAFPQKSSIVATEDALYIFDTKDNTLWMKFSEFGTADNDMSIIGTENSDHVSVYARDGIIYLANSGNSSEGGVLAIDFVNDTSELYAESGVAGRMTFNGRIAQRDSLLGYTSQDLDLGVKNSELSALVVRKINSKTYLAAAHSQGISIIDKKDALVMDIDTDESVTNIELSQAGNLYYTTENSQDLNVYYNLTRNFGSDSTSFLASNIYNQSSQPAIFTTAQDINDIEVVDNQVFIAHNAGLTVLNENQDNPSLSSVKYYGKDYITEEQIGDIRALYTFEDLEDKSVKGNNLTDSGASQTASGVRGLARTTAGSLTQTDSSVQFDPSSDSYSYGFWVKEGSIFHHYARIVRDGNATDYKDGQITTSNFDSSTVAISTSGITIASGKTIDDFFLTATPLTTQNIQSMYEIGRRASGIGSLVSIDNANIAGINRLGDSSLNLETNSLAGAYLEVIGGSGVGQTRRITGNSSNTIFVEPDFVISPDTSSDFSIISSAIYSKNSSSDLKVVSLSVDKNSGVIFTGVNNGDETGGITAIGRETDTILDIWHKQSGKEDDAGRSWNNDDIVAMSSQSGANSSLGYSDQASVLAIATTGELWQQSANQSLRDVVNRAIASNTSNLSVENDAGFYGNLTITDNEENPIFAVNGLNKNIIVREDIEFAGEARQISLPGLVATYIYDTSEDNDGGVWRLNTNNSWSNEQLGSSNRGQNSSFPQKAVLALTSDSLYIYDAKDNSLWMRFDEGGNDLTDMNLLGSANTDHNAIWAKNGIIYVANSSDSQGDGEGLLAINLKSDNTTIYTDSNNGVLTFNGVISQRNTESLGYDTQDSNLSFANANINDISVSNINGIDYIAVATQEGVSVINTQNNNIIDYDVNAQDSATNVYLTDAGTLYYTTETGQNLNVFFNIHTQTNDNTTDNGYSADIIYNQSSQPAIFTTAQDINDIEVVDNQVFIAHNAGLTVLNENQDNPSLSSVKYYGKDYITEEQIGDIRALYTFEDLEDKSVKGNNLTDSGASQTASGVRGLARTTAGSLTQTDSSVQFDPSSDSYSYGFWVKEGSIFHHYARIVRDGNATDYKDGQITTSNFDSSTVAISTSGITIASGKTIDDFFLTATPLTTQNIQSMYEIGRRAAIGFEGVANSSNTTHTNFRIGLSDSDNYSSGEFVGSLVQINDSLQALSETRVINQTVDSTSDKYIQFGPALNQKIANNDSFSVAPNVLGGASDRVSSLSYDKASKEIYIASGDDDNSKGFVSKVSLVSDTLVDVWSNGIGKQDNLREPFNLSAAFSVDAKSKSLAIATDKGIWSQSSAQTLSDRLLEPRTVMTVTRVVQTPKISSVNDLSLTASDKIKLIAGGEERVNISSDGVGVATSTPWALFSIGSKADTPSFAVGTATSTTSLIVSADGNVGIGTSDPQASLDVAGVVRIDASEENSILEFYQQGSKKWQIGNNLTGLGGDDSFFISNSDDEYGFVINQDGNVGLGNNSPLSRLDIGIKDDNISDFLQIDSESGSPLPQACDEAEESGRMIIDHADNKLYICNQVAGRGWDTVELTD